MPLRVLVVHDDQTFTGPLAHALSSAGYEVAAFTDPVPAWEELDTSRPIDVLISEVQFGPGKIYGMAMAERGRRQRAGLKVLFAARPELAPYARGFGAFMPMPAGVPDVVDAVDHLLGPATSVGVHAP